MKSILLYDLDESKIENIISDSIVRDDLSQNMNIKNIEYVKLYPRDNTNKNIYFLYSDRYKVIGLPLNSKNKNGIFTYFLTNLDNSILHNDVLYVSELDFILTLFFFDSKFRDLGVYEFRHNILEISSTILFTHQINLNFTISRDIIICNLVNKLISNLVKYTNYENFMSFYNRRIKDSFDFSVLWMYEWFYNINKKLKLDSHPGFKYDRDRQLFHTNYKGMIEFYHNHVISVYDINVKDVLSMF